MIKLSGYLRLFFRITFTILWIIIICFPLAITWQLRLERINSAIMMLSFYVGALLWGVRVTTRGTLATARPLLLVSNHFSYLDVFALGSRIPARFITKRDVASWPIIGLVCRMGGCLFIDRRPSQALRNMSELNYAAKKEAIISLFPEGTTSDGTGLLKFRSSFFSLAEDLDVAVQPVSIMYTALSGKPMNATSRPIVGWYGDVEFFPHMLRFFRESSVDVTLIFHDVVNNDMLTSRKALAKRCHDVIEESLKATA